MKKLLLLFVELFRVIGILYFELLKMLLTEFLALTRFLMVLILWPIASVAWFLGDKIWSKTKRDSDKQ